MRVGVILVAAMSFALGMGMGTRPDENIGREGNGLRRTGLDKMELKAAPNIWADLTEWTNGEALTAESIKGKVVVVGTWWSLYGPSHTTLASMQQLADKYGKDVIVVGVHAQTGWDKAKDVATDKKVKFVYAHDAAGKVHTALDVDQDPDFYVIDRAGNLRYADILSSSVDRAVASLVKETTAEAAAVPAKRTEAALKADVDAAKTKPIAGDLKPGQMLDVAFQLPDAGEYKDAKWPEKMKDAEWLSSTDVQGSSLPKPLGDESYIGKTPSAAGRVVVLDFWATWCGPCKRAMPMLEELFKENKKDLVLIGLSDEPRNTVEGFLRDHPHSYFMAYDTKAVLKSALTMNGIPQCLILSTDGVVRWQGNPHHPNFRNAVKKTIEADPGVAARRKAEAEYLKSKGG